VRVRERERERARERERLKYLGGGGTPLPKPTSELYRPRSRRLSAKLVPTSADRGVLLSQCGRSPTAVMLVFQTGAATFFFQVAPQLYSRG
jgi:hypothetical protein